MFHSLDRSEMFMELHREEKREEGDRDGREDKGVESKGEIWYDSTYVRVLD